MDEIKNTITRILENPLSLKFALLEWNEEAFELFRLNLGVEEAYNRIECDYVNELRQRFLIDNQLIVTDVNNVGNLDNVLIRIGDVSTIPRLHALNEIAITMVQDQNVEPAKEMPDTIWGFLIIVGNAEENIILFRKHYPIHLLREGKFFIRHLDDSYRLIDNESIIRLDTNFQCLKIGESWYSLDLGILERHFGLDEVQQRQAMAAFETLKNANLFKIKQSVYEASFKKKEIYRKILKVVESSQVLQLGIPRDNILKFSKENSAFKNKFTYTQTGEIEISSQRNLALFLKLMNDDFLKSELTEVIYDSPEKAVESSG